MVGATDEDDGEGGLVPAPSAGEEDMFLSGDGTYKSGGLPMVILSYGNSTWQDFINAYELAKPEELQDLPTKLAAEYYDVIETLLDVIIKNQKYRIEFNYTDYDSYSKEALEIIKERNGKIALPFEVTYKNKSAKCEIIFIIGGTYYNYKVNDKNFKWSQQFIDELKKELGA
jgi:hypothetical protein